MIPAAIAPKVAKLLPLLASDKDGEVIAAARALCRTLHAAGSDMHGLVSALTETQVGATPRAADPHDWCTEPDTPSPAPDAPAREWGMKLWDDQIEWWGRVAQHALMLDWTFPKAQGGRFLTAQERERLKAWTRSARLTNAEADWLKSVVERLHLVAEKSRAGRQAA